MKLKKKLNIIIIVMLIVLLILPLIVINFAKPHEFMGVMIVLFFIINPIFAAIINLLVGKDIKKCGGCQYCFLLFFYYRIG